MGLEPLEHQSARRQAITHHTRNMGLLLFGAPGVAVAFLAIGGPVLQGQASFRQAAMYVCICTAVGASTGWVWAIALLAAVRGRLSVRVSGCLIGGGLGTAVTLAVMVIWGLLHGAYGPSAFEPHNDVTEMALILMLTFSIVIGGGFGMWLGSIGSWLLAEETIQREAAMN